RSDRPERKPQIFSVRRTRRVSAVHTVIGGEPLLKRRARAGAYRPTIGWPGEDRHLTGMSVHQQVATLARTPDPAGTHEMGVEHIDPHRIAGLLDELLDDRNAPRPTTDHCDCAARTTPSPPPP